MQNPEVDTAFFLCESETHLLNRRATYSKGRINPLLKRGRHRLVRSHTPTQGTEVEVQVRCPPIKQSPWTTKSGKIE